VSRECVRKKEGECFRVGGGVYSDFVIAGCAYPAAVGDV
jgi:hypothetical protein